MKRLKVLSAGAAETLLRSVAPEFEAAEPCSIQSEFGNAGVIAAKLDAGEAADLVILPQKSIENFARTATVVPDSIAALGTVGTALAVPRGEDIPSLSSLDGLRTALLNSPTSTRRNGVTPRREFISGVSSRLWAYGIQSGHA
jgi:molybdate transport system substrate-binding protein